MGRNGGAHFTEILPYRKNKRLPLPKVMFAISEESPPEHDISPERKCRGKTQRPVTSRPVWIQIYQKTTPSLQTSSYVNQYVPHFLLLFVLNKSELGLFYLQPKESSHTLLPLQQSFLEHTHR